MDPRYLRRIAGAIPTRSGSLAKGDETVSPGANTVDYVPRAPLNEFPRAYAPVISASDLRDVLRALVT